MYRFLYTYIFFLVIALSLKAQENLVPNGSFEIYSQCPTDFSQIYRAIPWIYPTNGTSDFFHECASNNSDVNIPSNSVGNQLARSGYGYSGLLPASGDYREYIQVELINPLESGKAYDIEYYVSLADTFAISIYSVDMYISSFAPNANNFLFLPYTPQITNDTGNYFNWSDWTKVSGIYIANGGEKYITIGNFKNTLNTDTIKITEDINYNQSVSYVYIDDVSITEVVCNENFPNVFTPNNDRINENWQPKLCMEDNEQINIIIYNRWGQKMLETKGKNAFWDGKTTSGDEVPEGTYYYIITTTKETYTGTIQLLR